MDKNIMYNVKNRSSGMVVYSIPEDGVRREFMPGETKKITFGELEKLSFQSGGRALMNNYLLISSVEATKDLNLRTEPEYFYNEEQVAALIKTGSLDEFLDCLDFAPEGVIDILKDLSVKIPLQDYNKRKALKEKTGFDVDAAIRHIEEEKADQKNTIQQPVTGRRTQVAETAAPVRRTEGKYANIIIPSQENKE